jgi:hypothetical protein
VKRDLYLDCLQASRAPSAEWSYITPRHVGHPMSVAGRRICRFQELTISALCAEYGDTSALPQS